MIKQPKREKIDKWNNQYNLVQALQFKAKYLVSGWWLCTGNWECYPLLIGQIWRPTADIHVFLNLFCSHNSCLYVSQVLQLQNINNHLNQRETQLITHKFLENANGVENGLRTMIEFYNPQYKSWCDIREMQREQISRAILKTTSLSLLFSRSKQDHDLKTWEIQQSF